MNDAPEVTLAGVKAKHPRRRPRMLVRYGHANHLIRAITLEMDANVACAGGTLHKITGVDMVTQQSVWFYITDAQLSTYTVVK